MPDTPHDAAAISDAAAQRLIARAIELDARRTADVSVPQLREAVLEAGVSPAAFDAALAELRLTLQVAAPAAPESPRGRIAGPWARLRDRVRGAEPAAPATVPARIAVHGIALVAFWGALVLLMKLGGAADVAWPAQKLGAVLGTALGAWIAHRLGARIVKWPLLALTAAQGAELAMDLVWGAPAVLGASGHWAMILASVAGVGIGAALGRRRDATSAPPATERATTPVHAEPAPAADAPPRRLLRLRHPWTPRPATS